MNRILVSTKCWEHYPKANIIKCMLAARMNLFSPLGALKNGIDVAALRGELSAKAASAREMKCTAVPPVQLENEQTGEGCVRVLPAALIFFARLESVLLNVALRAARASP